MNLFGEHGGGTNQKDKQKLNGNASRTGASAEDDPASLKEKKKRARFPTKKPNSKNGERPFKFGNSD